MTMSIVDWPAAQRPRERLLELGPACLSDAELLAIFLRVGTPGKSVMELAMDLLHRFGSLEGLCKAVQREPSLGNGLGPAKCAQLSASPELAKRAIHSDLKQASALNSTRVVGEYLKLTFFGKEHECFVALFLNMRNNLLGTEELFRGSLNQTTVHPREVVKMALRYNAASVIVAHNHPSGDPRPSDSDLRLTKTLKQALELIEVELLDHIVVAGTRLYSFADHGKV